MDKPLPPNSPVSFLLPFYCYCYQTATLSSDDTATSEASARIRGQPTCPRQL